MPEWGTEGNAEIEWSEKFDTLDALEEDKQGYLNAVQSYMDEVGIAADARPGPEFQIEEV
jgi:hypothetical protein